MQAVARLLGKLSDQIHREAKWEIEAAERTGDAVAAGAVRSAAGRWDAAVHDLLDVGAGEDLLDEASNMQAVPLTAVAQSLPPTSPPRPRSATKTAPPQPPPNKEIITMTQAANVAPRPIMSAEEASSIPLKQEFISQHAVMQPAMATPERLAKAHQRVTLKNTSECQTHFIIDRRLQHIELKPGQSCEIDMLADELRNLVHLARTDRGFYQSGPRRGQAYPPHPVRVIGSHTQSVPALV